MAQPWQSAEPMAAQPGVAVPQAVLHKPRGGSLSGGKRALEQENAELRAALESIGAVEQERIRADIVRLRAEHDAWLRQMQAQQALASAELAATRQLIAATADEAILQEVGIYRYRHPLDSSVAFKGQLAQVQDHFKTMARNGGAVVGDTNWRVNGSVKEGSAMVRDFSKLMLRAYNNEADNAVRAMRPYKLDSAVDRLNKTRATISRLGKSMGIYVTDQYHALRVRELELTADYQAMLAEEKEREREEKARLREEAKARQEFERELDRLRKEASHYQAALEKMRANGDAAGIADAEAKLAGIQAGIEGVEARSANIRAGYVYVISNVGAFGERMVKIGMTRRLEPMDRVRELGDASVPFRYDVHALIFSEDAVSLETHLHQALADRKVNMVNPRREFFYATPSEVKELLGLFETNSLLSYEEVPEAVEWHQSENIRRQTVTTVVEG